EMTSVSINEQRSIDIASEIENFLARKSRGLCVRSENPISVCDQRAITGSGPQSPLFILIKRREIITSDSLGIAFVKDRKAHPIKPYKPIKSREPQITVLRLRYIADAVLRQPVIRVQRVEVVLR